MLHSIAYIFGEREKSELAQTMKEAIERREEYIDKSDKPGEVYSIEMYKHLLENRQSQKLLNSLENRRET